MVTVTAKDAAEKAVAVKNGDLPGPANGLAAALSRVWSRVKYVRKDKRMQGGGSYTYVSDAALIDAIRPELVVEGVVFAPVAMEPLAVEVFENKNGSRQNRVLLRVTYRFTHAASGETLDVVTCGEGMDVGDKATNKAMTAAAKYCLRQSFCVETGDDPDDTPSHEQERAYRPAPVAASRPTGDNHNPAIAKLAAAYATCKDMAGFERLEQERAQLWTRIDGAAKNRLKPISDETRERLAGAAV